MSMADEPPTRVARTETAASPHAAADQAVQAPVAVEPPKDLFWCPYDHDLTHAKPSILKFCQAAGDDTCPFRARIAQHARDEPNPDGSYSPIEGAAPLGPPPRDLRTKTPEQEPNIVANLGLTKPDGAGGRVLAPAEELEGIDVWVSRSGSCTHQDLYSISVLHIHESYLLFDRVQDILDEWYLGVDRFARFGPMCRLYPTYEPVFAYERSGLPNRANVSMEQSYRVNARDAAEQLSKLCRWAFFSKIAISEREEDAEREAFATHRTVMGLLVHLMDPHYQHDAAETGAMRHATWRLHSARAVIDFVQENLGVGRLQAAHLEFDPPVDTRTSRGR